MYMHIHFGQIGFVLENTTIRIANKLQKHMYSIAWPCFKEPAQVWNVLHSALGYHSTYLPLKFILLNPLTPGTFPKKCIFWTFWWFLGWIWAKLPLIRSKMRLPHNSLPFLAPASLFSALWLRHVQKSKFWERFWTRKWPTSLGFSIFGIFFSPFLFLLFSCFCCSDWPSTGLACG